MKEAFVKKADYFSDRNKDFFLANHSTDFTKGILFATGADWKAQRITSLTILRNFGMGKNILADKIAEEVSNFVKELAQTKGQPSNIHSLTLMSVSNIICSIIFGKRFELGDSEFVHMMKIFTELAETSPGTQVLNFLPALYYLPFDPLKGKRLLSVNEEFRGFSEEMIRKIKTDSGNVENYILEYLDAMRKEKQLGQTGYLDEVNLARNIELLFFAGSDTTSTTILWCLLYVLHYPEVQKNIFNEISEYIGTERLPNITDRPKMKHLTAFIMEVQRMASIVPLSLPHVCNAHTTVAGYTIPKGNVVLPNLDAVLGSKEIWGDPETFRPERFIDEQGNIVKREEFIPFSIGRRFCLGESLAMMELFLFLSTLFQKFEFLPPSPDKVPPLLETFGSVAAPEPFEIRCVERMK
ncbi:cytochrome P450 2 sub U member 1 [Bulinus truncatus]|nr:cytochrome P450 2 sub U member 1 [Bulinus truncatus]